MGPIGLDVGASGVRMLQLGLSGPRVSVVAAGRWELPHPGVDAQTRRAQVAQAVGQLLRTGKFHGCDVVSCLRTADLAIKNVRLPHMSDAELAAAALWEAEDRLGFAVTPDRLHCINAGEVRQGAEVRDEIILLGARAEAVEAHLEMLSEMRLRPVHLDAEPTALFRAYARLLRRAEDEGSVTVVVDIGLGATKVLVARGQTLVLIKLIDVAGGTLNDSVAKELGLSREEAAHVRRRGAGGKGAGADPHAGGAEKVQWSVIDALRGPVEALAREIALCLRYCSVTFRGLRCRKIILTGGEANDPALVKSLSECLNCECVVGEPLGGVNLSGADVLEDRRGLLTDWSVAAGLAFRGLPLGKSTRKPRHERSGVPA